MRLTRLARRTMPSLILHLHWKRRRSCSRSMPLSDIERANPFASALWIFGRPISMADRPAISICTFPKSWACHQTLSLRWCDAHTDVEMQDTSGKCAIAVPLRQLAGAASPCCFYHKTKDISVVLHGDDFTALGTDADLDVYEEGRRAL